MDGVTFVWLEDGPPPVVFGDWCHWDPEQGLHMAPSGEGWSAWLPLPPGAYVEYALIRDGRRLRDPLNLHRADNGSRRFNEQLWMPLATRRAEALHRRRVPRGHVEQGEIRLGFLAAPPLERRLDLYLPVGLAPGDDPDLPLLLVLDGPDYVDRGLLPRTLDALIADGAMARVAAAFLANAGEARSTEYAANDFTLAVLADHVVPEASARLGLRAPRVEGGPGRATILGSSLGGLMSLHAIARRPDVFGAGIAQSTSVMLHDIPTPAGTLRALRTTTVALIEVSPPSPARLWLDVGDLEDLAASNDDLFALLTARGWNATYRRYPSGHNQTAWGEALVDALPAMFPPAPSTEAA